MGKVHRRDAGSLDGIITNVTNLANANTSYTYVDLLRDGYKYLTLEHILSNTTLTIEACNQGSELNDTTFRDGVATANSAGGTILTDSGLAVPYPADTDLNQIQIRITQDDTTPGNVGLTRTVTAHTGATGAMTLSSAIGAITSGVTKYRLEDNPSKWGRRVGDPTSSQWLDVTLALTNAATHTVSGVWFFDTEIVLERFRVKRVTTNAANSCILRLSRGR